MRRVLEPANRGSRLAGVILAGLSVVFAVACETSPTGPSAASVSSAGTRTADEEPPPDLPKAPALNDALTGRWRGLYSWDCGNGMVGTEAVTFTIDQATSPVSYSGSATYLGATADISVGRFVGDVGDEGTWLRSLYGPIIEIDVPLSSANFAYNEFTGLLDGSHIEGTTLNGDSDAFPGANGCSALHGPSGTFSIDKF